MSDGYEGRMDGSEKYLVDPEGSMIFALEIEGIEIAQFLECGGLKTSTTVFEIEEGGVNQYVHKLPGQSRWENITLRYGVTSDLTLLEWRNQVMQDEFDSTNFYRSGAVVMKNLQNQEVRRYSFERAWPVAWEGPAFNAQSAELAVEMVELAHHGVTVSQ